MEDTPTMNFRFLRKEVLQPEFGAGVSALMPVLQQMFTTSSGAPIWKDVPTVDNEELEPTHGQ